MRRPAVSARVVLLGCYGPLWDLARGVRLQGGEEARQWPKVRGGELEGEVCPRETRADPEFPADIPDSNRSLRGFKPKSRCSFIRNLGEVAGGKEKVLFLLGDSTMRGLATCLCLQADERGGGNFGSGEVTWCRTAGLLTAFYGCNAGGQFKNAQQLAEMETALGREADAIVFNGGLLHLLHLMPNRTWRYDLWANLEALAAQWLDAVAVPGMQLVFKNTNSICEGKYTSEYQDLVHFTPEDPVAAAEPCQQFLTRDYPIDTASALLQCTRGLFGREGVMRLNRRMERVLEAWRDRRPDAPVREPDSFSTTDGRREHTGDGRHYARLCYGELGELWETLGWTGPVSESFARGRGCSGEDA